MLKEYVIKEAGFVYLYVSNNSPVNVYFDDVTITHTPTNVIQYNEYYPFGLQASTSWTREGNKNDFLYNAGSELNVTSGWYDLAFRNYDPALGRFMQVDPMATSTHNVGAYNYANDNPIAFNDPNGALPVPLEYILAWRAINGEGMAAVSRMGGGGSSSLSIPGSGNHWNDNYTDPTRDYFMMGTSDFEEKYGVDQSGTEFVNGKLFKVETTEGWTEYDGVIKESSYHYEAKFTALEAGPGDPKCPTCLDPSTVGNWFYTYGGPNNPLSYDGNSNYSLPPQNVSDKQALVHDKDYDKKGAVGGLSLVLNFSVIKDDMKFVRHQLTIAGLYATQFKPTIGGGVMYTPWIDPVTSKPLSFGTAANAFIQGVGLGIITAPKILAEGFFTHGPFK